MEGVRAGPTAPLVLAAKAAPARRRVVLDVAAAVLEALPAAQPALPPVVTPQAAVVATAPPTPKQQVPSCGSAAGLPRPPLLAPAAATPPVQ